MGHHRGRKRPNPVAFPPANNSMVFPRGLKTLPTCASTYEELLGARVATWPEKGSCPPPRVWGRPPAPSRFKGGRKVARRRPRVSPRGGQGSERAGSMCPAACGGCHLPAPQCGRRGPGAAVPTAPCTAVTQRARFRLKPRLLPAQAFAPACGASSPPASPAPLCQGSPS